MFYNVNKEFRSVFVVGREAMEKYLREINEMILRLNEKDIKIIKSLYTILLRYLEKRGRV